MSTHCPGYQKGDDPQAREVGKLTLRPRGLHWNTRNTVLWEESLLPCERAKISSEKPALAFKIRHQQWWQLTSKHQLLLPYNKSAKVPHLTYHLEQWSMLILAKRMLKRQGLKETIHQMVQAWEIWQRHNYYTVMLLYTVKTCHSYWFNKTLASSQA